MKSIGGLLLVLGIVGLLLNLILWLPAGFNLIVVVPISIVCFVAIWGGGKLSQAKTELVPAPAKQSELKVYEGQSYEYWYLISGRVEGIQFRSRRSCLKVIASDCEAIRDKGRS